jgi:CheY-like chemotaxis protein
MRVSGDFISVRILAFFASEPDADLLRQGATLAAIPAHFHPCGDLRVDAGRAHPGQCGYRAPRLRHGGDRQERATRHPPAVILLAPTAEEARELAAIGIADAIAVEPTRLPDAKTLIESRMRLKVPSRVLLVDDSSPMRNIVRTILTNCRFPLEIFEATDGLDALKQLGAGKFDFIFLDYNMPGLDGIEMLTQIKRQHPRTEIIVMTSAQDEALTRRAREAGAADFLKKPFYPADIDAVLYTFHGLRPPAP